MHKTDEEHHRLADCYSQHRPRRLSPMPARIRPSSALESTCRPWSRPRQWAVRYLMTGPEFRCRSTRRQRGSWGACAIQTVPGGVAGTDHLQAFERARDCTSRVIPFCGIEQRRLALKRCAASSASSSQWIFLLPCHEFWLTGSESSRY